MHDDIRSHYTRGDLLQRLQAALADDGADPARPTAEALAPYDQFHGRGLEATEDLAELVQPGAGDHLLDVGSGIGGPARYLAQRFGCSVSGVDLTPEFCEVATQLTRQLGLQQQVDFRVGDALALPFGEAAFDGAYSMNVSMNIADKAGLYRELWRVLKPGALAAAVGDRARHRARAGLPHALGGQRRHQLPGHAATDAPGPAAGRLRGAEAGRHARQGA